MMGWKSEQRGDSDELDVCNEDAGGYSGYTDAMWALEEGFYTQVEEGLVGGETSVQLPELSHSDVKPCMDMMTAALTAEWFGSGDPRRVVRMAPPLPETRNKGACANIGSHVAGDGGNLYRYNTYRTFPMRVALPLMPIHLLPKHFRMEVRAVPKGPNGQQSVGGSDARDISKWVVWKELSRRVAGRIQSLCRTLYSIHSLCCLSLPSAAHTATAIVHRT